MNTTPSNLEVTQADDPAYAEPLPPKWALDAAARNEGYESWFAVPTFFRSPENRRVIVEARRIVARYGASQVPAECKERASYLKAMEAEGQSTIMRQSMETLFKAAERIEELEAAAQRPSPNPSEVSGLADELSHEERLDYERRILSAECKAQAVLNGLRDKLNERIGAIEGHNEDAANALRGVVLDIEEIDVTDHSSFGLESAREAIEDICGCTVNGGFYQLHERDIAKLLTALRSIGVVERDGVERNVYLAARFSRRHECHALAKELQARGYQITSRWVKPEADHVLPVGISAQAADDERRRFALEDCEDVRAAGWTISLMEEPRSNTRGGRHIEFGMALALGHRLTIIGPRETVFHHLPAVEHYDTIDEFVAALSAAQDTTEVKP